MYAFVHRPIMQEFLAELQKVLESWKDHPWGKVIDTKHWDRMEKLVHTHQIIYDGRGNREQLSWGPTLVLNPPPESPIMQEEIFGPLLPILEYRDSGELIRRLASGPACLASYLFTEDPSLQDHFSKAVPAGSVCFNDIALQINNPYLPFGGIRESGQGSYHGEYSFRTFSFFRPVMKKSFHLDFPIRYPPHTPSKQRWLRRMLSYLSLV